MNGLLVFVWPASVTVAFAFGMYLEDRICRHMWGTHRYCPTCNRLACSTGCDA